MTRIKHPIFKDVELDVSKDDLADYLAAGWLEKNQRRKATVQEEPVAEENTTSDREE